MDNVFALKGDLCWSSDKNCLHTAENSYLICENGRCAGIFPFLPEQYWNIQCLDFSHQLILPGLVDLHLHAPQYPFRGMALDLELIDWLNTYTFPEESKYADLNYARNAYSIFADDLLHSPTTRACIFATLHTPATLLLMDLLEQTGLFVFVGKTNMDRNCPDTLREESPARAAAETVAWLRQCAFQRVKPILTPRFYPSCSDQLMEELSRIQKQYHLPVQSHLSENLSEIRWVQDLAPNSKFYGDAYDHFGLFGGDVPTIMAHCVHSGPDEINLMRKNGVYIAHCPQSNANLASGVAPVRAYLDQGLRIGLGSDMAAGYSLSIFRAMADAIQCSKLRWRLQDQSLAPLSVEEAFYLGTKGGGSFFGRVGSFETNFEFDAIVLDDSPLRTPLHLSPRERLERLMYLAEDRFLTAKFVQGRRIL